MKAVSRSFRLTIALAAAAAAATAAFVPARAENIPAVADGAASKRECGAPGELIRLTNPLKRLALRIAGGQPIKIVAIGSSSTAGSGASSPAMSYPSRLAIELKALFPRIEVTVLNRGIGGETTTEMLARFDRDVFADKPDVVVWQVGSNSVLRDISLADARARLYEGLRRLRAADLDVILMNPQYAPKVISKHEAEGMVDLIDLAAKETNVDLFQRYAIMRYWKLTEDIPFSTFVSPDELHMNDWSYGCVAKLLAGAIHEAASRSTVTATARNPQ
jgi:lysophospholipase L1-like esterase